MAIISINDVLRQEILESLEGSDSVLVKTIVDLTAQVKPGSDRTTIPNVTGLALSSVTSGSRATAGGMTTTGSVLLLDQVKQVPEYINYANGEQSALELKSAFLSHAPKVFAQGIEAVIAAKLATASSLDFDSASATAGVFTIADVAKAKKKLDQAKVPAKDRYMAVNAEGMEILASMSEFQDGQKSLSPEALRQGIVSQVKGFNVIQSEDIAGTGATLKVHFYHKSAVAFALQDGVNFIAQMDEAYGQEFVALRGIYGAIDCDNAGGAGKRKITMLCSTATA
jgi:hypothetical protein